MAEAELVIFDDAIARDWYPFTLTRPAGELLLGTLTLRSRAERVLGLRCVGYICAEHLNGFDEIGAPRVLGEGAPGRSSDRAIVYLSSRAVLHWDIDALDFSQETVLRAGDELAGWIIPVGAQHPTEDDFLAPSLDRPNARPLDIGAKLLDNVWDLIAHNHDHVASDVLHFFPNAPGGAVSGPIAGGFVEGAHFIGEYPLIVGDDVNIEPGVVFDLSAGPIWLEKGVTVRALTRIAGPMYVGQDSQLLGGLYTASSIGPLCKIHGEVEESIIIGYSNKAHEGFLGHAIVGKWCNFGALTTNSDLKNNYSNVRVHTPGGEV
ncbi:MAG TPA: putative sugar nucleotidyl transferase, partial [Longimicrobiales bacterium]|nr:putative sugar nucleotidyl transferase [Longimicrobiales bacterium]